MKHSPTPFSGFIYAESLKWFNWRGIAGVAMLLLGMILLVRREMTLLVEQGATSPICWVASSVQAAFGTLGHPALVALAALLVSIENENHTLKEIRLIQSRPYQLYIAKALLLVVVALVLLLGVVVGGLLSAAHTSRIGTTVQTAITPEGTNLPLWLLVAASLEFQCILNLSLLGGCLALVSESSASASGGAVCLFLLVDTLKEVLGFRDFVFWHHTNNFWNHLAAAADGMVWAGEADAWKALCVGTLSLVAMGCLFRFQVWRKVEH